LPYPADEEEENIASRIAEVAETEGTSVLFFEYGQPLPCGGVTAALKEPAFVKRSVQPILTLVFKGKDASLLYTSAVLHEAGLWPDEIDPANLFLLYGKHGPLVKAEFPCRGAVYLTSSDLAPYAEGRYSIIDSRLTFRLSEGKK